MTAPQTPNAANPPPLSPKGPLSDALIGGPVKPQPAAPLTDEQLRLECIKQAISAGVDTRCITESAERFAKYVKSGTPNNGESLKKSEGA